MYVENGGICQCKPGTYNNTVTCTECAQLFLGCLECDDTHCTLCDSAKFYDHAGAGCGCMTGFLSNNGKCEDCSTLIYGCNTCTLATVCDTCDHSVFFIESGYGTCICQVGYYDTSLKSCKLCSDDLRGCTMCNDRIRCIECD